MPVKVLGPLDTGESSLSPRERAILSALIVRRGGALPPAELADAYWGEAPPPTWPQQIKKSVATIRSRLGRDAVHTRNSGYVLGIDPELIDAVHFERLVSTARSHALHGEADRAVALYERALGLWRGQPYPDVASWEPGAVEALRLLEIRASAEEELLDERLRSGESRSVIATAERLVREDPLREERWAVLALANYRAGRQAEALATLRSARERLREELGIEPGERLRVLETAMLRQDAALTPEPAAPAPNVRCPYPGLVAFGPEQAELFFGREEDVAALLDRVHPGAIVVVSGASGSGKSSVLRAGVLPRLHRAGRSVTLSRVDGAFRSETIETADILAIDQFEEIFHLSTADIDDIDTALAEALERGAGVIVAVRSDFLDRSVRLPRTGVAIGRGVYALPPLSRASLRSAIEEPAHESGLRLEPGLVELILRDADGHDSTLPHVSHALSETWAKREGSTLTVAGYETVGGIAGAIAVSAESVFRTLDAREQAACRALMLRLISRDADGTSLRQGSAAAPLLADPVRRTVVERLIAARLITIDGDRLTIAHESVATAWPRLDGWLEADAEDARLTNRIATAAQEWDADGRPTESLLGGARLRSTLDWKERVAPDLTDVEEEFIGTSERHDLDETRDLAERAAAQKRQNRRLRWALGGAAGLLVAAIVSGSIAAGSAREAAASAEDSLIEAVTSRSIGLRDTNRDIAALLAAEAHHRWPGDPRTRAALMYSMTAAGPITGVTHLEGGGWRMGIWPIPGSTEAVVVDGETVAVHDVSTGDRVRTLTTDLVPSDQPLRPWVRVSGDGSTAVVLQHFTGPTADDATDDHELVYFFDLQSGSQIRPPVRVEVGAETFALSSNGRFASWAWPGILVVVDRDTGEVRTTDAFQPSTPSTGTRATTAFTASDELLVGNLDGSVWLVDVTTLSPAARWTLPADHVGWGLVSTEDGTVLGMGGAGLVAFTAGGEQLWSHDNERAAECTRIAASSESGVAVCGDELGMFQVRDLATGATIIPARSYQVGATGDLALVDGGTELLLLSATSPTVGHVRVDGAGPASEIIAPGYTVDGGYDASGGRLLVEEISNWEDGATIRSAVWDIDAGREVFRVPEDVVGDWDGFLGGLRWLGEDAILTWDVTQDADGAEQFEALVIDIRTGRVLDTGIPADTWEVYPSTQPGRVLVATRPGREILSIDTTTLEPTGAPIATEDEPFTVSSNESGTRLVTTSWSDEDDRFTTRVLDAKTGRVVAEGLPTMQSATSLHDGTVLASDDGSLSRFDGDDLARLATLPSSASWPERIHLDAAGDLALLKGFGPRAIALIDIANELPLGDPLPEQSALGVASFAPAGASFVYPGRSGIVQWTLEPAELARSACRLAGRNLTPEEWHTYLGRLGPPRNTCEDQPSA